MLNLGPSRNERDLDNEATPEERTRYTAYAYAPTPGVDRAHHAIGRFDWKGGRGPWSADLHACGGMPASCMHMGPLPSGWWTRKHPNCAPRCPTCPMPAPAATGATAHSESVRKADHACLASQAQVQAAKRAGAPRVGKEGTCMQLPTNPEARAFL